jgi:hypothetical protein
MVVRLTLYRIQARKIRDFKHVKIDTTVTAEITKRKKRDASKAVSIGRSSTAKHLLINTDISEILSLYIGNYKII